MAMINSVQHKLLASAALALAAVTSVNAAPLSFGDETRAKPPRNIFGESAERKAERLKWWTDARFGMFIHFGLFSELGRHEWVKSNELIDDENYDRHVKYFNPDLFDAKEWAKTAKAAGMKYMVLTTKHHEGFCMWDTATTDYKITNTEFGRDVVKEFVEACRAEGLGVGFYFSLKDWHHPDYLVDVTHPKRPGEIHNRNQFENGQHQYDIPDGYYEKANEGKDWNRFREYMFAQVKELLGGKYGKIDIIWFDYVVKHPKYGKTWEAFDSVNLLKLARTLQPDIIVDSRLDLMDTEDGWDFVTPEQFKVTEHPKWEGKNAYWETCQTFSGSWGYYRDEYTWKSAHQCLELLIHSVSFGGNLIMNVGPTGRGDFDARAKDRLAAYGKWMHWNSRSIYGCTEAPAGFKKPDNALLTYNPKTNRLYVHLLDYQPGALWIEFADKIEYARFLHDASEIRVRQGRGGGHSQGGEVRRPGAFIIPVIQPDQEIPVIECFLKP